MTGSKKVKAGQVVTTAKNSAVLNGTIKDLKMVEELYATDREAEAIALIDRILELPEGINPAIQRLYFLLTEGNKLEVETHVHDVTDERTLLSVEMRLGGAFAGDLMIIRSKCFSALLDTPSGRSDPNVRRQAVENAEIITRLFSNDSFLLTLAAQSLFMCGELEAALTLLEKAISLDPKNIIAKATLKVVGAGIEGKTFTAMTEKALMMMDEISNEKRSTDDMRIVDDLLNQSLDIFEHQARAWAGKAWVHASWYEKDDALEALRKAQKYGPEDHMVQQITKALDKLGWLDEPTSSSRIKKPWWKFGK